MIQLGDSLLRLLMFNVWYYFTNCFGLRGSDVHIQMWLRGVVFKTDHVDGRAYLEDTKRGNHNPYIEEQTTQWPKEKVQKEKQRFTQYTYKTKDRVTWTPLKTGGDLRCSGRVSSPCSTSDVEYMGRMTKTHDRTGKENNRKIKNVIVGWKFTKLKG